MEASFFLSPPLAGWALRPDARGAAPREQVGRLGSYSPKWRGCAPTPPIGRALRPAPRGFLRGWQPLHPPVGLPGPHPGFLSFHDERNQRRAGAAPLDPQCVIAALFALAALRFGSRRATFYHQPRPICHFEMGGRIGLVFFLWFHRGNTLCFQSVARRVDELAISGSCNHNLLTSL